LDSTASAKKNERKKMDGTVSKTKEKKEKTDSKRHE